MLAPYALSTSEADRFLRRDDPRHAAPPRSCGALNRLAATLYPRQVSHGMLFYPAAVTLALATIGALPPRPWLLGGGGADLVCALGSDHATTLEAAGLPVHQIEVTGQASTDALVRGGADRGVVAARLRAQYALHGSKPIVICAVPQHAEHGMADWSSHRAAVANLFAALRSSDACVLLSLHPKMDVTSYRPLADDHGLPILEERLSAVLPAADLFVATFSSTVRWAIGLGIPTLLIDELATGYRVFDELPGVIVVTTHEDLLVRLCEAISHPGQLSSLSAQARAGAGISGTIDGASASRIADAVARLVRSRHRADQA